jgi:colanic acid/amylovoran biosynthesis protein
LGRIKDSDVVVSCSDENFKESASMLPLNVYWVLTWWTLLLSKTWEILVARFLGKKVVMFPNSVGPFRTYIGRLVSKIALEKCDFILVREPISRDIVRDLKIDSNVILTSDTTLLFKSQEKVRTKNVHPIVTVCPGIYSQTLPEKETSRYISAHAKALDLAIDKYGFFVQFLPHYVRGFRYDDLDICRLIHRKMKNADRAKIIEANSVEEFISRIGETDMMISSKMHPSVLATAAFVPSLCVAYDHKQTGFFMSLGLSDCILPIREVTWDKLLSKIEYVWDKKDEIRTMLKTRVPILQEDVKKSIRLVLSHSIRACRS